MLGIRCASIVLPVPGLPIRSTLYLIAGGGGFKRTLDVFLTFYVAKNQSAFEALDAK